MMDYWNTCFMSGDNFWVIGRNCVGNNDYVGIMYVFWVMVEINCCI